MPPFYDVDRVRWDETVVGRLAAQVQALQPIDVLPLPFVADLREHVGEILVIWSKSRLIEGTDVDREENDVFIGEKGVVGL